MGDSVLEIGKIFGGVTAENTKWEPDLRWVTKAVRAAVQDLDPGIRIGMHLQVPGPILKPDFEGARWGRSSRKDGLLTVQVALPEAPPPEPRTYLIDRILEGLDQAEAWAEKRKFPADIDMIRERVRAISFAEDTPARSSTHD